MIRVRTKCFMAFVLMATVGAAATSPSLAQTAPVASDFAAPDVTAAVGPEQVRFASLGLARQIRLEVLDQSGATVYDSDLRDGNLLDWSLADTAGRALPDGLYGALVTVVEPSGRTTRRSEAFWVRNGSARFGDASRNEAAAGEARSSFVFLERSPRRAVTLLGHDGKSGRITSGAGPLSFRIGDLLAGEDVEQMRLTTDGRLGIGVEEPAARLDVAGLIRTSEGIQFPDGTIQRTAADPASGARPGGVVILRQAVASGSPARAVGSRQFAGSNPSGAGLGPNGRVQGAEEANNTYYGSNAGLNNSSGTSNAFFGDNAGLFNTTGSSNTFVGHTTGPFNTTASENTFVGSDAGFFSTGSANTFLGTAAGFSNTTGKNNVAVGRNAGRDNTTDDNNTFVGFNATSPAGITNATAIGYRAQVTASNSLVLGGVNGVNGATAEINVGIGVTNPDRQLTVEGSQALARFRRFSNSGAGFGPALLFERARGTQASASDIVAGDHLGKVQFRGRVGGNQLEYGAFSYVATDTAQNGRFAFFDRDIATERVSILNTGNVGIGTTSPTERLHVVGNLRLSGSILTGAPADPVPDYVFEPGYKLLPIEELARFVAREKHLPNVPGVREIEEKGLDLGGFQMRLLEKTEELTLYAVAQARAVERKDAEIAALQARLAALEQKVDQLLRAGMPDPK